MLTETIELGGVIWHYRPETNDLGILDQVFTRNACHIPDDMTGRRFVDIGAHIGAASVLAAQRGAQVWAFEPSEPARALLDATAKQNGLNIRSIGVGVGQPGVRKLYTDPYNTGQSSAYLLFPELDPERFEYMTVITLAEVLTLTKGADFLKVDCEGCEAEVFHQLVELPEWPPTISVEFHRDDRAILERLAEHYDGVQLSNDGYLLEARA